MRSSRQVGGREAWIGDRQRGKLVRGRGGKDGICWEWEEEIHTWVGVGSDWVGDWVDVHFRKVRRER